jgi:hypothetical protein
LPWPTHQPTPAGVNQTTQQLYNEEVNDLLAPENLRLPIHESKEAGVYVAGLREDIVMSPEQVGPGPLALAPVALRALPCAFRGGQTRVMGSRKQC